MIFTNIQYLANSEQRKPEIVERPANQTIDISSPISLTCSATGNPPPTYQWYKDGEPVPGETCSHLYMLNHCLPTEVTITA